MGSHGPSSSPSETFSAILTLEGPPQPGIGGIALLTLSDTEDSLHFLLLFRGLLESRSGGKRDGAGHVRRVGRAPVPQRHPHAWPLQDRPRFPCGSRFCTRGSYCESSRPMPQYR